jgi:hypothetical protein
MQSVNFKFKEILVNSMVAMRERKKIFGTGL